MKILGCKERAEDVVQDAYIKILEATSKLDIKQPVSYLFQLVRNLAIDKYRRSSIEERVFADEEEGVDIQSPICTPEMLVSHRQHLSLISDALSTLKDQTRKAFELYLFSGLTQREIAQQLGISPTLVNFMIRDATICCKNALP